MIEKGLIYEKIIRIILIFIFNNKWLNGQYSKNCDGIINVSKTPHKLLVSARQVRLKPCLRFFDIFSEKYTLVIMYETDKSYKKNIQKIGEFKTDHCGHAQTSQISFTSGNHWFKCIVMHNNKQIDERKFGIAIKKSCK